jgi:ATP-binding cassette, subfamily B, bacterial MsbA
MAVMTDNFAMISDLRLYLRLLGYARPYWRVAALSVLAMVCSAGLEPIFPALMQPLIDKSLIAREGASLWQVPLFIVLVFLLKGVADYVANISSQYIAQRTIADLRALVFAKQLDLPMAVHQREQGGRMLSRVINETALVGEAVSSAWLTIVRDSLVLIGLLGFLFYTAWQLTLLVLLMAPFLALAIQRTNQRIRRSSERAQGFMGRISGLVEEALAGLKEIKIFNAHHSQSTEFQKVSQDLRRENMRAIRIQALNVPLVQVMAACSVALVIYVASLLSRQDALSPGEFVAFITAMSMIFEPIRRLTNVSATLQKGLAAAQSLFGLLDADGETHRPDDHEAPTSYTLSGDIDFQNLSFSYPGQDQDAVSGLTLKVREGESVVLVGPSGFGKSTLLYLLAGLDTPRSGRILIGGTDLCYIDRLILRANLSMVAQQTVLFDMSILENVRLARPTASNEDVLRALSDANALAFVKRLPRGVDTPLGFHGSRLSGGQRQRLALARAFLKDAPILLLDEPTSALDGENETEVLEAIQCLSRGRTTLIVSHDPEKLSWVNRVLDLSKPSSGSPVVQHD